MISERIVQKNDLLVQEYSEPYQIVGISGKTFMLGKQITK